jgi:integrase
MRPDGCEVARADPSAAALSEGDQARLPAALDKPATPAEKRDRALFLVLLRVGLRIGSAVALDVEGVDFEGATLRLRKMKNFDTDEAFVSRETAELLRGGRKSGPVFSTQPAPASRPALRTRGSSPWRSERGSNGRSRLTTSGTRSRWRSTAGRAISSSPRGHCAIARLRARPSTRGRARQECVRRWRRADPQSRSKNQWM